MMNVKNDFNSIRWSEILDALEQVLRVTKYPLRMIANYH